MHTPESPPTPTPEGTAGEHPFVIVLHQRDRTPGGYFRPEATVTVSRALRTSGLLLALPPEDVKSLLLLLTFITANGWCRPALPELAEAMRVGEGKARARLRRLAEFPWQGRPLVTEVGSETGLVSYAPSPAVVGQRQAPPEPPPAQNPLPPAAGRETIVAHSRALYARPRAEVERDIAERMGWGPPAFEEDAPAVAEGKQEAYRRMTDLGMPREQALDLLARFDLGRIGRQLDWLPHRAAKSPARFLAAAIEGDYEAPPAVRSRQTFMPESPPGQDTPGEDTPGGVPLGQTRNPAGPGPAGADDGTGLSAAA